METSDEDYRRSAELLGRIARDYPSDSPEESALKLAGQALLFARQQDVRGDFDRFVSTFDEGLDDKQKAHLRRMGIDRSTEQ